MRKLIINERGKKIVFKERIVRTPVHLMVTDKDFRLLEVQLRLQGITNYELVEDNKKTEPIIEEVKIKLYEEKEIPEDKADTILERLASNKK